MKDNADTMNQPDNLPPDLPPLPPVPPGFDRWVYRGTAWEKSNVEAFACAWVIVPKGIAPQWHEERDDDAHGYDDAHYIEAVREEHAKDESAPATAPPCDCIQGYVQETGFDRCETCNAALATETKGCEGVESRVCQDIAARQRLGIAKYGCTDAESNDDMLQHAYEEALDLSCYLRRLIELRKMVTRE